MAKRRKATVAPTPVRVRHEHDPVKERRNKRIVIGAIAGVMLIAFGVAAYGYYQSYWQPPRQTALSVGDRDFSASDLATRIKLKIADDGGIDTENPSLPDAEEILTQMQDEEVVRQSSSLIGFTPTEAEVNASIAERLGVEYGGPGTPFDTAYRDELRRSGLDDGQYHELIAADVIEKKVQATFGTALPDTSDQVELDVILVDSEEEAQTVIKRIKGTPTQVAPGGRGEKDDTSVTVNLGGEDFATVAQSASRDTETAPNGGSMEWTPYGVLDPAVEKVAFTIDRGELSEPIEGDEGWWVIQTTNRRLGSLIEDSTRQDMVSSAYETWLKQRAEALNAQQFLDDDMRTWVLTEALQ